MRLPLHDELDSEDVLAWLAPFLEILARAMRRLPAHVHEIAAGAALGRDHPSPMLLLDLAQCRDRQAPLTACLGRFDGGHDSTPSPSGGGPDRMGVAGTAIRA